MAKYLKEFSTTAEYESYINNSPTLPNVSLTLDDNVVHYNKKPDYSKEYLTFEALESGTFGLTMNYPSDSKMTSISYSVDNGATWVDTVIGETLVIITTPTVNAGDKVLWKGVGSKLGNENNTARSAKFKSTGNCNVSGNIMSLLYGDNFVGQTTISGYGAFSNVFANYLNNVCKIVNAKNLILPATTLANYCYSNMFYGCRALTTAPVLPATTLKPYCYQYMFSNCTSLTTAPELPATTLANGCYSNMFSDCTSLTTAPELPATTLASSCYNNMFGRCRSLNRIKMLATDISATNCLNNWVQGVAATGTFTKAASMTTLPTGTSGIPSGWTVVDA